MSSRILTFSMAGFGWGPGMGEGSGMGCHTLLHAHKCYVTKTRTFMPTSSIHVSQNENTSIPYHDQLETVRSWRSAFETPAQWTLPRLDPCGRPPGGHRDPNSRRVEMGRSPHGATWQSHVAGPSRPSPTPSTSQLHQSSPASLPPQFAARNSCQGPAVFWF